MTGSDLDIPERDTGVKSSHDEGGPEHVGVDDPEPGPLANGADPTMGSTAIQAMTVLSTEDRSFGALPDDQVESPGCSWDERYDRRLAAFAHNPQSTVSAIDGEVLDVGPAGFAHPEAVESEQHCESGMVPIESLCGVEKRPELSTVGPSSLGRVDLGSTDVLAWIGRNPSVDVGKAIEATDRRQSSVYGRRGELTLLH